MITQRKDLAALTQQFRANGRIHVADFLLPEVANCIHQTAREWREWGLVTRVGGQHRVFDADAMEALTPERRAPLDELVFAEAKAGFQYLYERFPLYERGRSEQLGHHGLDQAYALIRSPPFIDLARELCGNSDIRFADGQLTRYRRGHFLTLHDDSAPELQRVAAYVLNLSRDWAADFGGQLQFTDSTGHVTEAVLPRFNQLTLFKVPTPHLVSAVAPFVTGARFAITGWFRMGEEGVVPT
ncbi:MAG: 2OG-Fe(II) oxygenase [Pseudomarimonas sp.]